MFLNCSYFMMIWKPVFAISLVNWFNLLLSEPTDICVCCQFACFVRIFQSSGYFQTTATTAPAVVIFLGLVFLSYHF